MFFNLYVGNNDSHAKNLSILYTAEHGVRLAPFYDLMATTLYAGLSKKFAFTIGGESNPGDVEVTHIQAMAAQLGFKKKYVSDIAAKLAENLVAVIADVVKELSPVVRHGTEKTMLDRLHQAILSNTKKLGRRWTV